jgi:glycosyltransferase involved in cell wall biosynthesis
MISQHAVAIGIGKGEGSPLVSCIMPTYNRRPFVAQAIAYFLRQTYANCELIIVDDGVDAVQDAIPDDPRIRYVRLPRKLTTGAKRNLACEEARGDIIAHWDDDDWVAPWRLRYQVENLLEAKADICGINAVMYYAPASEQAWQFIYPKGRQPWVAALCYTKAFWQRNPFPDLNVGEDTRFLWSRRPKHVVALPDNGFYIALVHAGNSSSKHTSGAWWHPFSVARIQQLMVHDWAFYAGLAPQARTATSEAANALQGSAPDGPLVSCIMPTHNRRRFVPQAIRYFGQQDYANRELIVVDDGGAAVEHLLPDDPRIRYVRLSGKYDIGVKRNLACEIAQGDIIVLWDDDDWYAPHRISYQVAPLLGDQADITGLGNSYFFSLPTRQFWTCSADLHDRMYAEGVVGGTLAFRKRLWGRGGRFPRASLAEDAAFLRTLLQHGARLMRLPNIDAFFYVRHGANSWRFTLGTFLDRKGWRQVEPPSFLPAADLAFYGIRRPMVRVS